jgi:hypothetical protein
MAQQGPENLLDLGAPRTVWEAEGIKVTEALDARGSALVEIVAKRGLVAACNLSYAFEHFRGDAILRDSFSYGPDICINFWREAA